MCPTVSPDHGSAPALSWQDWLAVPSCLQRPECLSACVFPSGPWERAAARPAPRRAAAVPQGSSLSCPGGLGGCWGCGGTPGLLSGVSVGVRAAEVPPCADWAVLPAGRVAMESEGTLDLQTLPRFGDELGLPEGEAAGRRLPSDPCQCRQL